MKEFLEFRGPVLPVAGRSVLEMDQRALHVGSGRHGTESESWIANEIMKKGSRALEFITRGKQRDVSTLLLTSAQVNQ